MARVIQQPQPQPGWYDDPGGSAQERYWEGTRWTKNLRDRPDPLPGTTGPTRETATEQHASAPMPSAQQPGSQQPGLAQRQVMPQQYQPGPPGSAGAYAPHPQVAYKMVRTTQDGVPLAGFVPRALATVIDTILMSAIGVLIGWPYVVRAWNAYQQVISWMLDNPGRTVVFGDYDYATPAGIVQMVILSVSFVAQVLLVKHFGGTVGQLLMGLRVVPAERGLTPRVSWNTSLLRSGVWLAVMAASQIVLFPLLISYLRPLWHPRLQTWHDSLAHTQVITTRSDFAKSALARPDQPTP